MCVTQQWTPEGWAFNTLARYTRSAFNHPAKVRLVRFLGCLIANRVVRFSGGGRIAIDMCDYIGWALLMQRSWEPHSLARSIELMKGGDGSVFLDVGAHHGLFAIAVAAAAGCEVVAVEPSLQNFGILLGNLRINPGLKVSPVNCCASPDETLLQLTSEAEGRSAW